jgi:acetate kinase
MTDEGVILALNAGSSSIKFAGFGHDFGRKFGGELEGIGNHPKLTVTNDQTGNRIDVDWSGPGAGDVPVLIRRLIGWIESQEACGRLSAIGHRVAIGGLEHTGPELVTDALVSKLQALVPLAPMHQPRNIEPIDALHASHPHIAQVACFDTAFHRTIPHIGQLYGLPRRLSDAGARRYGFHGLSYEYISGKLPELDANAATGRTIVCHLGSGASLCAMRNGKSIATTMGFSPLSGVVMATRPGDLDPGLMIWLLREQGMSVDSIEHMLYYQAGWKGVSGISSDMRDLLDSKDRRATEAVDLFVHSVISEIGRLAAILGGLDALVFTAGIGEHAPSIRAAICQRFGWLGIDLDAKANNTNAECISTAYSGITVFVIPTNEELMVAEHTARLALGKVGMRRKG